MKIVYVAMKYDYGVRERGKSFEETAFFDTLQMMGHNLVRFDFMEETQAHGRDKMNRRLRETVFDETPDVMFCVLFKNEISKATIRELTEKSGAVTINWFCDDHWRFENFSRHYAPNFSWVTTTDKASITKYKNIGYETVIHTQWACNHHVFKKHSKPFEYDVTFVGQPHGNRRKVIDLLLSRGINVKTWGFGWPNGRLTTRGMVDVFNQSKINLNLSNSSKDRLKFWQKRPDQIKGRNFEIPSCGGFQLASFVDYIDEYFTLDQEIVCFNSNEEMIERIEYFLDHEAERKSIAHAGYARAIRDHTYQHRFDEIFAKVFR